MAGMVGTIGLPPAVAKHFIAAMTSFTFALRRSKRAAGSRISPVSARLALDVAATVAVDAE